MQERVDQTVGTAGTVTKERRVTRALAVRMAHEDRRAQRATKVFPVPKGTSVLMVRAGRTVATARKETPVPQALPAPTVRKGQMVPQAKMGPRVFLVSKARLGCPATQVPPGKTA